MNSLTYHITEAWFHDSVNITFTKICLPNFQALVTNFNSRRGGGHGKSLSETLGLISGLALELPHLLILVQMISISGARKC